jgi:tetratricopeptide (TPR) repeat protein
MVYNWGLASYYNPYYVVEQPFAIEQPIVYDYSQPINPTVAPPDATVADTADDLFERGREAFKTGMYTAALDFADQALRQMPNDPSLHEFRALSLFAMKRYDDAAAALYPVLSIGPGWDWPTLIGLYNNDAAPYTDQLRALEAFVKESPNSASAHFLLSYHYLCQGHGEEALKQLRAASQLQPKDSLSSKLVRTLEKMRGDALGPEADAKPADAAPVQAAPAPGLEPPAVAVPAGNLEGVWTAAPDDRTKITLDLTKADRFDWSVDQGGGVKSFQGVRSQAGGFMTLVQDADPTQPPMVGRTVWKDEDHFTFHLAGVDPSEPGLEFSRSK